MKPRYQSLPINPERFYVAGWRVGVKKRSWLKVDDVGVVLDTSKAFKWAVGKSIEEVEEWCKSKDIPIRSMHGNIKNIKQYL